MDAKIDLPPPITTLQLLPAVFTAPARHANASHPLRDVIRLQPGDVLSLVDPQIAHGHSLLSVLQGARYAPAGSVQVDGHDLNNLTLGSLQALIGEPVTRLPGDGTIWECMQAICPEMTREQGEAFACSLLTPEMWEEVEEGLDTFVSHALKRSREQPFQASMVPRYLALREALPSVLLCTPLRMRNPIRHYMLQQFIRQYRDRCITIWADTAPREDLGDQHIIVARGGQVEAAGDLAWFNRTYPDWDRAPPQPVRRPAVTDDLEVVEEEMLLEDG